MKTGFFILAKENSGAVDRLVSEIKCVFSDYLNDDGDVMLFSGIKEATADIAKAVENTHALVFIAATEDFGNTKSMLSKAFGFPLKCDEELAGKLCETLGVQREEIEESALVTHAFMPENARKFVLEDGMYGGFSVVNGNQTVILLPLESVRTSVLLFSKVAPYLNSVYHISASIEKLKEYNCIRLNEQLERFNVRLAVAHTNTATFFKEYTDSCEALADKLSFSEIAEKRGDMQPVDYVVNLSITACELLNCPYAVAISNAFYTDSESDSEKVVYLAVTNDRETSVREIHSLKGEEISDFLTRCCNDLCYFVSDVLQNDNSYDRDLQIREKAAVKRYKKALITVASLIAAAAVFCGVYFAVNDYTISQWGTDFIDWVFPAGNPFAGFFDKFVPGEDEEKVGADTDTSENLEESTWESEENTDTTEDESDISSLEEESSEA